MAPGRTAPGATNAISIVNNYINACTPSVTATGFSTHEIEIFDFVIECREKRIAAKRGNLWEKFREYIMMFEVEN